LITAAYLSSFFNPVKRKYAGVALASVRAGNVIGGGDWAKDRLVPDIMRAVFAGRAASIRNPAAVRPWQHVLEPLRGYLMLAERLWDDPNKFTGPWNFGPCDDDIQPVRNVVAMLKEKLGKSLQTEDRFDPNAWHEANLLKLDISKAQSLLGWTPYLRLKDAIARTVAWYQAARDGEDMGTVTLAQINSYAAATSANALTG
jgi:CDP-glucose 4,6-dehydratase